MNNGAATHRHVEKAHRPATSHDEDAAEHEDTDSPVTAYMAEHAWPRFTVGIALAAGAGLAAVSLIGAAPAAIAGAAGYLAYRELSGKRTNGARKEKSHR